MNLDFKIIDSHVHFPVKGEGPSYVMQKYVEEFGKEKLSIIQEKNKYQQDKWRLAWGFDSPEPTSEDIKVTAKKWIDEVEKNHIDKVIFVTAGNYETSNKNMEEIVSMYPDKFIGYAYHDPFGENAADELERAITKGKLSGFKILAPDLTGRIDDKSLYPLWEVANKYKVPVLIHFGVLGGAGGIANHVNISPMMIHDVARAFPEVPFIVPHFGCGQLEDALQLAWVCPNIYIDTSGSNQWIRWMPYSLTIKDLFKKYYETIGPQRIIFGTDSSYFPRGFAKRYFEDQLRDCIELGMNEADIKMIFRENMAFLLNITTNKIDW
jgi:hypothetical protein